MTAGRSREQLIARIARELAQGEVVEGLASRLAPSDLQSLMLHVYRERSATRTPAELLAQYERAPMLRPSSVDGRAVRELEDDAFASAPAFEAIELAPVAPLG